MHPRVENTQKQMEKHNRTTQVFKMTKRNKNHQNNDENLIAFKNPSQSSSYKSKLPEKYWQDKWKRVH